MNDFCLQEAIESGRLRAKWTTYLLMGDALLSLASIAVRFFQIKRFSGFNGTTPLTEIGVNDLDTLEGLVSLAGMMASLVTAVFFLMWIYRAARNLSLLGVRDQHYSPRLAVCSFIIPFANLFIPHRVVKEIWRRSDTSLENLTSESKKPATPVFIGWWWESWVFSNLIASITFHPGLKAETVSQRLTMVWLGLISEAVLLLAVVLAMRVIKAINSRQIESSQRIPNFSQPPSPPIFK